MILKKFLAIFLFIYSISSAQTDNKTIRVVGDRLFGKVINGESIREVHGNVVMVQGDVKITCKKAIQYLARNEAELIGQVVVTQDSIVVNTELGYYYGNEKIAFSKSGVKLFDGHVNLKSKNGYYYFNEKKAFFYDKVELSDLTSTLTTDRLTYYNDEDKAVASGNVVVKDSSSILSADSLIHFRNTKRTFAYKNVLALDTEDHLAIFGDELEDDDISGYSKMFGDPILVKIDTTETGALDTLVISAKMLEAFNDSSKRMVATDSVRIARKGLASVNGFTIFFQDEDRLFTVKRENDNVQPVLWNENIQLIGDTVNVYLKDNRIRDLEIKSNASIISQNEIINSRYDQISGKEIKMFFNKDGLQKTDVMGNVLSIYYLYEEGEPNGLLKSSAERGIIYFADSEVKNVKFYGNALSEYHPENIIIGKEKDFMIPSFIIIKNKPTKETIIAKRAKDFFSRLIKFQNNGKQTNSKK